MPSSTNRCSPVCVAVRWIVAILLLIAAVASGIGVWETHVRDGAIAFGSSNASFALIAFTLSLWAFMRQMMKAMMNPCEVCAQR